MPKVYEKNKTKKWLAIAAAAVIVTMGAVSSLNQVAINVDELTENPATDWLFSVNGGTSESLLYGTDIQNRIAIIRVNGTIQSGTSSSFLAESYNHQAIMEQFTLAAYDPTVKGILLAVDSPGGGVYESAQLRDHIQALKVETGKPIYTSFGSTSASGGYYISAETDKIFAANETLTGSIGVIMSGYNYSQLLENIGVEDMTIKSGAMKDILSSAREMTDAEKDVLQGYINESFERFLEVVMNGRDLTREEALKLADGRIFSGKQAVENGLVDEIGYEEDALNALVTSLSLNDPQVFEYHYEVGASLNNYLPFNFKWSEQSLSTQMSRLLKNIESSQSPRAQYLYKGDF